MDPEGEVPSGGGSGGIVGVAVDLSSKVVLETSALDGATEEMEAAEGDANSFSS